MRITKLLTGLIVGVACLVAPLIPWQASAYAAVESGKRGTVASAESLDNATCLICHGSKADKLVTPGADGKPRALQPIQENQFVRAVHGEMTCVACHVEIADSRAPHRKTGALKPNCVDCHTSIWADVQQRGLTREMTRLGIVVQNIEAYQNSFHAQPSAEDKTVPNATCDNCHDTHYFNVPPRGTARRSEWHLTIPQTCGEQCHSDQLETYAPSVHGIEILDKRNPKAATCTDCHTVHAVGKISQDDTRLLVVENCGGCHRENYATYGDTYHGKVARLGYAYTALCYDCHGSHEILRVNDPDAKVHPDNRLETCQQCHDGHDRPLATAGFASFGPHANAHDYERYPQMWIAAKFMHGLLLFVFAYFWAHSLLWWYREYRDRKERKNRPHIRTEEALQGEARYVRRFSLIWRVAHLAFALSVMTLILTGMVVFYSYTDWARVVANALGGPQVTGIIHRTAAAIMLGIFFAHLVGVGVNIWRQRKTFRWFGPDSLVPNWKDFRDAAGMFAWFVNKGPRPVFDRWTYWEKFDYWAVFWGMAVIGTTGMILAFPQVTASIFPGWVFNVASLVHGEEAFLAAVFLFTVHFFNNHFRPDKLPPPDVVMFTGVQTLDEFRRDHAQQYQRLVDSGQLENYLVEAPSRPMTIGSRILGLTLIAIGLILLVLVTMGFFGGYTPHPWWEPMHP